MTEARKSDAKPVLKFDPLLGVFIDSRTGQPVVKKPRAKPKLVTRHDFRLDTTSVFDRVPDMVVTKDADGFVVGNAGKKSLSIKPRLTFRRGTFWRVVGENVRIEAMCNYGNGPTGSPIWSGWSRHLPIGTIVECIGWRRFRRDGLVAPQFVYPELPAEAKWSSVWPHDGVWRPWPLEGILERVDAPTEDA